MKEKIRMGQGITIWLFNMVGNFSLLLGRSVAISEYTIHTDYQKFYVCVRYYLRGVTQHFSWFLFLITLLIITAYR